MEIVFNLSEISKKIKPEINEVINKKILESVRMILDGTEYSEKITSLIKDQLTDSTLQTIANVTVEKLLKDNLPTSNPK